MTTEGHQDLTARLTALADEAAPPQQIDPARSIAEGTTRLRRRRGMLIGAAAAVTAVVVATTALVSPGKGSNSLLPADDAPATVLPSPVTVRPPLADGPDPLAVDFRFGWLPAWAVGGEKAVGYQAGGPRSPGSAYPPGNIAEVRTNGPGQPNLTLSMYAAGEEPPMLAPGNRKLIRSEAEPVNGATAYWAAPNGTTTNRSELRWLTASGRWAQLEGYGGNPGDITEEVLHRIASGVTFGHFAVPLPVRFTSLPATLKPDSVSLSRPDRDSAAAWGLWMGFQVDGKEISVNLHPDVGPDPTPTGTDGSPYINPNPSLKTTRNGVRVSVTADTAVPPTLEALGGLPWLLAHTDPLGVDPSTWTTDVIVP
ncbi:hypothetical protein [Streptomyces sp. NRRL WC-3742]|uniref:hypothetical protein n=1 Tax=Streptomyces sp. NRRL WC-3742 TaxID=1463934 RepID=UPI0004C855CD|nr:hypothetical protein [Streptomyces sp. NRRL WC-3742]